MRGTTSWSVDTSNGGTPATVPPDGSGRGPARPGVGEGPGRPGLHQRPGGPLRHQLDADPAGGQHHVCFEVDDIIAARDTLIERGAKVLGTGEPRIGAHGTPILFLHPKGTGGVLVELMETPKGAH